MIEINEEARIGVLALAALLVVSVVSVGDPVAAHENGVSVEDSDADGHDGTKSDDTSEVFTKPITLSLAGVTITLGPPTDPDGDGVFEDITGDSEESVIDALAHAAAVTAVDRGLLSLTDGQTTALDVDSDGDLTYRDTLALVRTTTSDAIEQAG